MAQETAREEGQAFDPQAPFIADDGYEYENFAAYLIREKADCWRVYSFVTDE